MNKMSKEDMYIYMYQHHLAPCNCFSGGLETLRINKLNLLYKNKLQKEYWVECTACGKKGYLSKTMKGAVLNWNELIQYKLGWNRKTKVRRRNSINDDN